MIQYNGLQLSSSFHSNYIQLIHLQLNQNLNNKLVEQNVKQYYEIINDKYIKAYVDPSQLSYNSFENILNLDQKLKNIQISINNFHYQKQYYKFNIHDHKNMLINLHKMNLYTLPLNNKSRGGKRMIFSSINLADQLTKQLNNVQNNNKINNLQNRKLFKNFHSINHVFRLNSFSPKDNKFSAHYDTPFCDKRRNLYSRYTLLIYLTGGNSNNNPCLKINNSEINKIQKFTGIIFDQKYQHQGYPYIDQQKIFIRTQLIYYIPFLQHNSLIAYFFNKACYFTKQSIYNQQLQKYSSDLFNHTAKLRYSIKSKIQDKYLIKKNYNIIYVTNGSTFWFKDSYQLKFIIKLVLIDYFNAKLQTKSKIISKQYRLTTIDDSAIIQCLDNFTFNQDKPNKINISFNNIIKQQQQDINIIQYRCGICDGSEQPRTSGQYYQCARQICLQKVLSKTSDLSVILLNGQVLINDDNIIINDKQIQLNNAYLNKTINFASCQCETYPARYFIKKQHDQLQGYFLPNIPYKKINGGYKLSVDIFNNGFIHKTKVKFSKPITVEPKYNKNKQQYQQFYNNQQQYTGSEYQNQQQQQQQKIQQQSE